MSEGMNRLLNEGENPPSQDSSVVSAQHSLVYTDSSVYAASTLYSESTPAAVGAAAINQSINHRLGPAHSCSHLISVQNHEAGTSSTVEGEGHSNSQTQNQTKDNLVNEMVKQKLLMLESNDETRL